VRVGGLFLRALAFLAVTAFSSLIAVPAAPAATNTVVSLTFDDGQASQRSVMDMLDAHGMRGTFYINSALVDTSSYYMTWAQIHEIYNAGHEIGGHTLHHTNLTTVNASTATTEVCNDRQAIIAQGLGPVTSFAYPEAAVNSTAEGIVKSCGYSSGRGVGDLFGPDCPCPYAETIPPTDAYQLRTPGSAGTSTTLADLQAAVTNAETHGGGWVPLVFHGVCDNACTDVNTTTVATFTAFLDWLQQRSSLGTTVRTVADVMGGGSPPPPAVPVTTISCNQAACSTGWYRTAPVRVSLATTASPATTWYTTDGSDPTGSATRQQFTGPFDLIETATIRFYSVSGTGATETPRSQLVSIDTAAPTATMTSPANGATISRRSNAVTIAATVRDLGTGSGSPSGVRQVVFYDGSTIVGTATTPNPGAAVYAVSWKVRQAALGQHSLKAVATDLTGNSTGSTPVTVTIVK
jgi:peptidoglycan/xylan/chitin deacetylase (PgdA/CDA1 family)